MDKNEAASVIQRFLTCRDTCRDECYGYCETCRYNTEYDEENEALKLAIKAFDKDIDAPSKWIPVSEKLPEEDGIYLVSGGGKVWSAQCLTFGCFRGWSNDVRNPAVSAWMPLPEPYKEGEENENVN